MVKRTDVVVASSRDLGEPLREFVRIEVAVQPRVIGTLKKLDPYVEFVDRGIGGEHPDPLIGTDEHGCARVWHSSGVHAIGEP
jgi:hypothetical protein